MTWGPAQSHRLRTPRERAVAADAGRRVDSERLGAGRGGPTLGRPAQRPEPPGRRGPRARAAASASPWPPAAERARCSAERTHEARARAAAQSAGSERFVLATAGSGRTPGCASAPAHRQARAPRAPLARAVGSRGRLTESKTPDGGAGPLAKAAGRQGRGKACGRRADARGRSRRRMPHRRDAQARGRDLGRHQGLARLEVRDPAVHEACRLGEGKPPAKQLIHLGPSRPGHGRRRGDPERGGVDRVVHADREVCHSGSACARAGWRRGASREGSAACVERSPPRQSAGKWPLRAARWPQPKSGNDWGTTSSRTHTDTGRGAFATRGACLGHTELEVPQEPERRAPSVLDQMPSV